MRRLALLLPLLPAAIAAQSATNPIVRYHFGDNPAWANPDFDDSARPVAQEGR